MDSPTALLHSPCSFERETLSSSLYQKGGTPKSHSMPQHGAGMAAQATLNLKQWQPLPSKVTRQEAHASEVADMSHKMPNRVGLHVDLRALPSRKTGRGYLFVNVLALNCMLIFTCRWQLILKFGCNSQMRFACCLPSAMALRSNNDVGGLACKPLPLTLQIACALLPQCPALISLACAFTDPITDYHTPMALCIGNHTWRIHMQLL